MKNSLLSDLVIRKGMTLSFQNERMVELKLSDPIGKGTMTGYVLSPHVVVCLVDFACEECPSMMPGSQFSGNDIVEHIKNVTKTNSVPRSTENSDADKWLSINYCIEGRCETDIPHAGVAVVSETDVCVSFSHTSDEGYEPPRSFRYPLARYVGIEVFVCTEVLNEPEFSLLREADNDVVYIWSQAGPSAIFSGDKELIAQMKRASSAAQSSDWVQAKLAVLELLWTLSRRDYNLAKPRTLLTPAQLHMAKTAHDLIESSPIQPHDARDIASEMGVSATTLNGYFQKMYGMTIASYARRQRIRLAKETLMQGKRVSIAACEAGYSNPSKFAAAFKRETGMTPSEFRKK